MESLVKVNLDLNATIHNSKINFKKSPKDRLASVQYIEARLELLEELWAQFTLTHTQIIQQSEEKLLKESIYSTSQVYGNTMDLYIDYKSDLKAALSKLNSTTSVIKETTVVQSNTCDLVKLPKISIPCFSGLYSEWISFRDLFTSLVHTNKSLDNVQKLHYLKGHLTGEAEQLLRHIPITQDNYMICWDTLEKRYNNKKYLSNCILKRFFSQRNITTESAGALKELLDTTNECLHALRNLSIDVSSWDIIVIHILCLKLDSETRKQWELRVSEYSEDLPTYSQFQEFLETRFRALEFIDTKAIKNSVPSRSVHNNVSYSNNPKVHYVTALSCVFCSEAHKIAFCKSFAKLGTDDRRSYVQSNNMCFNCLNQGHSVYLCRQPTRCRICNKKHHSLLHPKDHTASAESNVGENHSVEKKVVTHVTEESTPHEEASNITTCFSTSRNQVLLATALVKAQSKTGSGITLRCLLDQGSQASFVSKSAVQLLGLQEIPHKATISGLGSDGGTSMSSNAVVRLQLSSLLDPNLKLNVQAFVLGKLTSILPENKIDVEFWSELSSLKLADPSFNIPGKVDMLLGTDVYSQILLDGVIKLPKRAPVAQRTALGWILFGPIQSNDSELHKNISVNHIQIAENRHPKALLGLEADKFATDPKPFHTNNENKYSEKLAATMKSDNLGTLTLRNSTAAKHLSYLENSVEEENLRLAREKGTILPVLKLNCERGTDRFECTIELSSSKDPILNGSKRLKLSEDKKLKGKTKFTLKRLIRVARTYERKHNVNEGRKLKASKEIGIKNPLTFMDPAVRGILVVRMCGKFCCAGFSRRTTFVIARDEPGSYWSWKHLSRFYHHPKWKHQMSEPSVEEVEFAKKSVLVRTG